MIVADLIKNIWNNRTVINALVETNFKGRYKNSIFGILWQVITPLILVLLFYIVFKTIRYTGNEKLWLLLCIGIFSYSNLESSIIGGGMCIVNNSALVKKMNVPRELFVISHILSNLISYLILLVIIIIFAVLSTSFIPLQYYLTLFLVIILMIVFEVGTTLFLSAIVVYYRDIGFFMTAISKLLFWTSPTVYTVQDLSGLLQSLLWCNPMTWFISPIHDILYYGTLPPLELMVVCVLSSIVALFVGAYVFNKLKDRMVDLL